MSNCYVEMESSKVKNLELLSYVCMILGVVVVGLGEGRQMHNEVRFTVKYLLLIFKRGLVYLSLFPYKGSPLLTLFG